MDSDQLLSTSIRKTVGTIQNLTKNVYERLMQIQDNFRKIISLSCQWVNTPMYSRDKNTKLITFDNRLTETKINRYAQVRDASAKIQILLKENLLLFHNICLRDPNHGK